MRVQAEVARRCASDVVNVRQTEWAVVASYAHDQGIVVRKPKLTQTISAYHPGRTHYYESVRSVTRTKADGSMIKSLETGTCNGP